LDDESDERTFEKLIVKYTSEARKLKKETNKNQQTFPEEMKGEGHQTTQWRCGHRVGVC
jgi:hypothetical protein